MARSGSPAKSKSTAVIVDDSKKSVDAVSTTTTTTTTTTVTVVDEETVINAASFSKEESSKEDSNEEGKRELPIFNNPLLADEKSTAVALKPKGGRVKVQRGKTATIAVLKMSAPKADGEVVVMRRMDSNLVNATLMFQAAFPAATEQWITKENSYLTKTYVPHGAVVEDAEDGTSLAGVWVTISQAKELAKEYSIEQFMLPLLNAPARKNTIKATTSSSPSPSTEVVAKEEQLTVEETVTAAVIVENVAVTSSKESVVVEASTEVVTEEKIIETLEINEVKEVEVTEVTEEKVEAEEKEEKNDQEQEQEQSTGSKRGREEDEEQTEKDRKRFRGFVTVAVGLAAVAITIPQVLPYFS